MTNHPNERWTNVADLRNDPRQLDYAEAQNVAGAALHGAESPEPVIVARSSSDQTLTVSATPVDDPPLVMGGQGRDASEVEADAVGTVRLVVLAILSAAILALGVWAAAA